MAKKKPTKRKPSTMPKIRTQEPPKTREQGEVPTGKLQLEFREGFGYAWPPGVEQPGRWHVRTPVPCPECKMVRNERGRQAVIAKAIRRSTDGGGVAYLFCRGCGHDWKLPIAE